MAWYDFFKPKSTFDMKAETTSTLTSPMTATTGRPTRFEDDGIFKSYIPDFFYKPPYGFPRKVNTSFLKDLAKNPYIFSVLKTIADEASNVPWKIKVKEEFQDDGKDYSDDIEIATKFFKNPNGNQESFKHLLKQWIYDLGEVDSAAGVKVFNRKGVMTQLFARDGASFLKNTDIYGYIGDKQNFVPPVPVSMGTVEVNFFGPNQAEQRLIKQYNLLFLDRAAYFQYGATVSSFPVPFGKREVMYIMQNPRSDNIYGRSPVEILVDIILVLVYGSQFNLDYYVNNNMPEGVISLLGAQEDQIKQFRENWESKFTFTDQLNIKRKRFFKVPIASTEVQFTPFQINPKDMDIVGQQEWFTKIMWMNYGVTAEEMGFTDDSNRATSKTQSQLSIKKALKPTLQVIKYHLDNEILPEFYSSAATAGTGGLTDLNEIPPFSEIPIEFIFEEEDLDHDKKQLDLFEQQIRMGVKTSEMVAAEMKIDVEELKKHKEDALRQQQEIMGKEADKESGFTDQTGKEEREETDEDKEPSKEKEEKAILDEPKPPVEKVEDNPLKISRKLTKFVDEIEDSLIEEIDKIPEDQIA